MTRVFLLAHYDPQGKAGEGVRYLIRALLPLGRVIIASDCAVASSEWDGLDVDVVYSKHHGEYDFGSYKRCFAALDTDSCDVLYLLNDSVAGPLYSLEPYLDRMEALGSPAFGLVWHPSRRGNEHLQSWFLGFRKEVFRSKWFRDFIMGVGPCSSKEEVCQRYESGLTRLLRLKGIEPKALFCAPGKSIYNRALAYWRRGLPFYKKAAYTRHGGCMGLQIRRILKHSDPLLSEAERKDMDRIYGAGFSSRVLKGGHLRMFARLRNNLTEKIWK